MSWLSLRVRETPDSVPRVILASHARTNAFLILVAQIQRNADNTPARGFEPLKAEPNGFRVHLLSRSDALSWFSVMVRSFSNARPWVASCCVPAEYGQDFKTYSPRHITCPCGLIDGRHVLDLSIFDQIIKALEALGVGHFI